MKKDISAKEYKLAILEALLEGGPEALVIEMPRIGELPSYSSTPKVIDLPPVATTVVEPEPKPLEPESQLASTAVYSDQVPAPVAEVSTPVMAETNVPQAAAPKRETGQVSVERVYETDVNAADLAAEPNISDPAYGIEPETSSLSYEVEEPAEFVSTQAGIPPKECIEVWQSLQKGMTKKRVKSLMGEPDKVSDRIIDYWSYVTSNGSKGYIYFDEGKLTGWREPYIGQ